MMIDVSDPHIRREIEARIQRELESERVVVDRWDSGWIYWIGNLVVHLLHVFWLLGQVSS